MKNLDDFESLYHQTYAKLAKYVFYRLKNATDTQDILQDIYLAYYKQTQKQRLPILYKQAYLYKIANHMIALYFLKQATQPKPLKTELDMIDLIPDDLQLET